MSEGPRRERPSWEGIDTVLLDMDGTLLDRHFDDYFWEEHVPGRYAERTGISLVEAKERLGTLYRSQEGTLNWTDLDYWSSQLELDIPSLKREVDHLITVHPTVLPFLDRVRQSGKTVWLVTNAHGWTLELKMEKTALEGAFHGITTSHDLGMPKEDIRFWRRLREQIGFDSSRTLLADDTLAVLETAARFGIRFTVHVARASSALPAAPSDRFFSIERLEEIAPP